jgi:predicted RNA-binding protein
LYSVEKLNHETLPEPGIIVLKGGDDLFFNKHVLNFYHFILEVWDPPPKRIALYLGCTHHKPFSGSFIHKKLMRMLTKHELDETVQQFIVSEPLVICPRELEKTFPAANYDFPPQYLGEIGKREFILRLRNFLHKHIHHYEFHVSFMPNHHKEIFMQAAKGLLQAQFVPYNLYYLPRLLSHLRDLKMKCTEIK